MTKEDRHAIILETLRKHESIPVNELSSLLEVSSVTIRKDLTELENSGKLYRSHGKAVLINPYTPNRSVNNKEKLCCNEKHAIALRAASMITRDDSIILASGTTIHAMARCIKPLGRLTVVSASIVTSAVLAAEENVDIIQLGGTLRHSSHSVVGKYAETSLADFYCSKLFMGVDGIDLEFGITTTDLREADLNRIMMQTAQKTIVLADATKFNRRGFSKISNIDDVDIIVTDDRINDKIASRIEDLGIELVVATPDPLNAF